jgi:hypothetical protein
MCHLLSKVSSIFSNALRSSKSAILALALVLTSSFAITAQASVSGDWRLAPEAGALSIDPWWSNVDGDVQSRYCLFDDVYSFNDDGSFTATMDNLTWVELWQSGVTDVCAAPVAPHDGTTPATYTYDSDANTLTLTGNGAFVGLAKAVNGAELAAGDAVPDTRTYTVSDLTATSMTLSIDVGGDNPWVFKLVTDASVAAPSAPVLGCTNDSATNYDADATQDDGTCVLPAFDPAAPTPTDEADSVLSIFSDAYADQAGTNFDPNWGQATDAVVTEVLTYNNLNYQGTDIASSDVSGYGYIRFDAYTANTTALKFTIISPGAENLIDVSDQLVLNQWVTIEIPLSDFVADLTAVNQMKFADGNGTLVLDNIYFGGTAPVAVLGCTNASADNYDADATQDDGSCTFPATTYCATKVTHFNIPNHAAAIRLTVENSGDDSITVTASAADSGATLDHFEVKGVSNSGTAATTISDSGVGTSVISWPADTMPAYTTFEVHWSDDVAPGQMFVHSGGGNDALGYVDTAYVCPLDSDGDGVADDADAFPNDPSESADSDGDTVGDNADAFPNNASETLDSDGDGTGDNADVFPNDASETLDSDSDGTGDNADYAPNDPSVQTAPIVSIVFDFEDNTVQYQSYGGVAASYASQDDAGVTRNMLKLVNGLNAEWWSGVTLAVTPAGNNFRGDGSAPATMRVYAEQDGNLNLELEADGQVPAVVNLAVTQGWNDLSFDFSDADAAINWHKIQVRPDAAGQAVNAAETTYFIDDLTFPNASILDSDGDGANDLVDDLPNDATETVDSDGDGVGDNADELPND